LENPSIRQLSGVTLVFNKSGVLLDLSREQVNIILSGPQVKMHWKGIKM